MLGTFTIPEIADILEASLELIVEKRDELIIDQIYLNEDILNYTLPKKEKKSEPISKNQK